MRDSLSKTWSLIAPHERRKTALMVSLIVLMALTETVSVLSIMPFLSVLSRQEILTENPWLYRAFEISNLADIRQFTIALGFASIITVIAASAFKILTHHTLNRFVHFLRHSISTRLLEKYLNQPYTFFLSRNSADLSKNLLSETDLLLSNLIQPFSQLVAQGSVVLAMIVLVVVYDPLMATCIVVVVGGLYAVIYSLVRRRLLYTGAQRLTANRDRYQASNEALVGIKDVKVTHSFVAYSDRFTRASREFSRHLATSETLSQTPLYAVEAVGYSGLILISLTLLWQSADITHVLPALGLYGFAAYRMLPAAQIMYRSIAKLKFSSPALEAIHSDLTLPEGNTSDTNHIPTPEHEIRLEGIRFTYPLSKQPILDNFSLTIPANSSLAIVGKSGAGKSTVMDILLGLLQPQEGALRVDGTIIDASNVAAWQRNIGYVPQHIFLSDSSVAENIALGVARAEIDMNAVEQAARAAQIHDFVITELPQGYETRLGDRGSRLSGGQRQRIGIARSLYRDPAVLFMDEATSALDSETEGAINMAIRNLSGKKTVVVIAHHKEAVDSCQHIVSVTS